MHMELLSAQPSPFARKARVLVHESGLADEVKIIEVATTPIDTDLLVAKANPLGKIPALVIPDMRPIYDSRVICRYLDCYAKAGLYPEDRLWETLTVEATADGVMDAAVLMTYERRIRPENMVSETWLDAQWAKIARAVESIDMSEMFMPDQPLGMGHIGMGCALAYLDFRHGDRNWRDGNERLEEWFELFSQRDSMKATAPE